MNILEILKQEGALNAERHAMKIQLMHDYEMAHEESEFDRNDDDLKDPFNRTSIAMDGIKYINGYESDRIKELRCQLAYADNIHGINKGHITREQYTKNLTIIEATWEKLPKSDTDITEFSSDWV